MNTKDNTKIYELIDSASNNNFDALNNLHKLFNPLILKYASLLNISVDELTSEFDLVILKIYKANILDDRKILKYIKTTFKNIKNKPNNYSQFTDLIKSYNIESNIIFDDLIKSLDKKNQEIINLRFKYQYTLSEIGDYFGISKQAVYQNIHKSLNYLKKIIED